ELPVVMAAEQFAGQRQVVEGDDLLAQLHDPAGFGQPAADLAKVTQHHGKVGLAAGLAGLTVLAGLPLVDADIGQEGKVGQPLVDDAHALASRVAALLIHAPPSDHCGPRALGSLNTPRPRLPPAPSGSQPLARSSRARCKACRARPSTCARRCGCKVPMRRVSGVCQSTSSLNSAPSITPPVKRSMRLCISTVLLPCRRRSWNNNRPATPWSFSALPNNSITAGQASVSGVPPIPAKSPVRQR